MQLFTAVGSIYSRQGSLIRLVTLNVWKMSVPKIDRYNPHMTSLIKEGSSDVIWGFYLSMLNDISRKLKRIESKQHFYTTLIYVLMVFLYLPSTTCWRGIMADRSNPTTTGFFLSAPRFTSIQINRYYLVYRRRIFQYSEDDFLFQFWLKASF